MPAIPAEITSLLVDVQSNLEVFKGQLKESFASVDITTVAAILLVIAGLIIVYDLLVYVFATATTARSLMLSPLLAKFATKAWESRDELGLSNMIESRSMDSLSVLEALTKAAEKYDQEEHELQSAEAHEKEE